MLCCFSFAFCVYVVVIGLLLKNGVLLNNFKLSLKKDFKFIKSILTPYLNIIS